MKINQLLAGLILLANLTSGCNNKKESESSTADNKTSAATLPFVSSQEVNTLYSQAEQVDIIFYKLPISVNQDDPASAKNTVLYVAPAAPVITNNANLSEGSPGFPVAKSSKKLISTSVKDAIILYLWKMD